MRQLTRWSRCRTAMEEGDRVEQRAIEAVDDLLERVEHLDVVLDHGCSVGASINHRARSRITQYLVA